MKPLAILLALLFTCSVLAQEKPDFNLSFERIDSERNFPPKWHDRWNQVGYTLSPDSVIKAGGKYSMKIELTGAKTDENFGCIVQEIPVNFKGNQVTLKGKMKLENVKGAAGLLLRIDSKDDMLQFDNMGQRRISGTQDWQEFTITLPLDADEARYLYIGAVLQGSGKIWVDDFSLTVDTTAIGDVNFQPLKFYKADYDKEFDNGSRIEINEVNERMTDNLYQLGKVWGFLKYYHPAVAKGDYNWDYELFRVIPKVINTQDKTERDRVFLEWINSLGPILEINNSAIPESITVRIQPELGWISDSKNFSSELISKLQEVKNAKRTDTSYYIGMYEYVGNPKFKNESNYTDIALDDGHRLLALFRYWNMVQYFFPDKHLIGEDWNGVLKEFIPLFIKGKTDAEYHLNAVKLITRVNDSHANVWGYDKFLEDFRGKYMAPYKITFIEEKPVVTGTFQHGANNFDKASGLNTGDEIISINGKSSADIVKGMLPTTPGSNRAAQLRDIAWKFLRSGDSVLNIKFVRNGETMSQKVQCYLYASYDYTSFYNKSSVGMWKMLDNNIGYLYPGKMKNDSLEAIMSKLKDTKGIVIDFRCYPSDFLVFTLSKYLKPLPSPFVRFTMGSIQQPGMFTESELLYCGDTNANSYKGKIIIIVNEETQSSAEYHTMAFRTAPNAKVIGSTTAGADGNVSAIYLPGKIFTYISGIGVLTPEGKETQRVGIIPNVEVKPTIKGFRAGKDEVLEKAIELITK